MPFIDILIQLSSYPDATPIAVVDQGVRLASIIGTSISALTFKVDFHVPRHALGDLIVDIPGMVATERAKSEANALDMVNAFGAAATKLGLPHDHIIVDRCLSAEIPDIVTDYARMRDLTIVPIDSPPNVQRYIAECVIFGSGRPVIVLPATPTRDAVVLDTVGIAFDFSCQAVRAVADALPLLIRAKTVRVVTVTNEKVIDTKRSGLEFARHLALHGVEVVLDEKDAAGRSIGQVLEAYAAEKDLDLLVMGAHGHLRMRDFFLGGATKSIVDNPTLPVFLSH